MSLESASRAGDGTRRLETGLRGLGTGLRRQDTGLRRPGTGLCLLGASAGSSRFVACSRRASLRNGSRLVAIILAAVRGRHVGGRGEIRDGRTRKDVRRAGAVDVGV